MPNDQATPTLKPCPDAIEVTQAGIRAHAISLIKTEAQELGYCDEYIFGFDAPDGDDVLTVQAVERALATQAAEVARLKELLVNMTAAHMVEPRRGWCLTALNRANDEAREYLGLASVTDLNPELKQMVEAAEKNRDALMSMGPMGRLRDENARLRELLSDATALIGHRIPMDSQALVAGKTLMAREVWEAGRYALFPALSAQPSEPASATLAWGPPREMSAWDKRDEMVLLLVRFDAHPTDDAAYAITIGGNNDHNVGEGEGEGWQFAGWCWSHDHFVEGKGEPVGWWPLPHEFAQVLERQPSEQEGGE